MNRRPKIEGAQRRDSSLDDLDEGEAPLDGPDEHTRLLPNRVDSQRELLLPDDPAVSPYNLWTIRILRYVTILFAVLTFTWWTLLLVSTFATPHGLHQRGSNFYAFSFASMALANLLFTLVFFGIPAKSVRVVAVSMSVCRTRFHNPQAVTLSNTLRVSSLSCFSILFSSYLSKRLITRKAG